MLIPRYIAQNTLVPHFEGDGEIFTFKGGKKVVYKLLSSILGWRLSQKVVSEDLQARWSFAGHFSKRVRERGEGFNEKQIFASFLFPRTRRRLSNLLVKQAKGFLLVKRADEKKLVLYVDGEKQLIFCCTLLTAEMSYNRESFELGIVEE